MGGELHLMLHVQSGQLMYTDQAQGYHVRLRRTLGEMIVCSSSRTPVLQRVRCLGPNIAGEYLARHFRHNQNS
jgi:hypothetical protein